MKEFVAFPTEEEQLRMNEKMMALVFCRRYRMYIKNLGQFFFHTYLLTCLKKDTLVLL